MNIDESRHWRGSGLKEVVDLWLWNPTSLRVLVENPGVVVLRNKNGTDWDVSSEVRSFRPDADPDALANQFGELQLNKVFFIYKNLPIYVCTLCPW